MALQFSKKLCVRKEPERGCLAKWTTPAPKDTCPILQLPSEVRACIFNYIFDEANLTYKLPQGWNERDLTEAKCFVRWPDYKKKLSFLKACKLFEAEALSLIQVKSATFDSEDPAPCPVSYPVAQSGASNNPIHPSRWNSCPQEIPLPLSRVCPHLREVNTDPEMLVPLLNNTTDLLSLFPKLKTIRVTQRLPGFDHRHHHHQSQQQPHRAGPLELRESLENPVTRRELICHSLRQRHLCQLSKYQSPEASPNPSPGPDNRSASASRLRNQQRFHKLVIILEYARVLTNNQVSILVDVTADFTSSNNYNYNHSHQHQHQQPPSPAPSATTQIQTQTHFPQPIPQPIPDRDRDPVSYPVRRAVSSLRYTHGWPARNMEALAVDLWSQHMETAIKTKWTETVALTEAERQGERRR